MGALTLKNFPFELRGWDIEKFESFDPTDGFGSNTKVYINKNVIVQIEPSYNHYNFTSWLHDKGRQYFDSILKTWFEQEKSVLIKDHWTKLFYAMIITMYVFDHCWTSSDKKCFFTFVCDYLSLEVLKLLMLISHNYSCVVLKTTEQSKKNIDLEYNFQLNNITNHTQLNSSTICLLIATNPRHEGYCLHLKLRQRFLKGNFKCLTIGSLIDLTFPISFLGANLSLAKTITKGNNLICQDLKFATNPIIIYNSELLKRNDNTSTILKVLSFYNIFNSIWNGLSKLSAALSDVGTSTLKQIPRLKLKDLNIFSSLYFLNAAVSNISNLKKVTELKLLRCLVKNDRQFLANKLLIDQNHKINKNWMALTKVLKNYVYTPKNTFYESEQTFINVEGFIKKTTKLIKGKSTKSEWQILRKFLQHCKSKLTFLALKDNQMIYFNSKKLYHFKHFLNFQYYALQALNHMNFNLAVKNKTITLNFLEFKLPIKKVWATKIKPKLDDFFIEGKDQYSSDSNSLNRNSRVLRAACPNFQIV